MKKQSKKPLQCPNCGNQNVKLVARKHEYRLSVVLLGLFLLCVPALLYFCCPSCHVHNDVAYALGFMMGFVGIIVLFIARHARSHYKCNHCGHEFTKR